MAAQEAPGCPGEVRPCAQAAGQHLNTGPAGSRMGSALCPLHARLPSLLFLLGVAAAVSRGDWPSRVPVAPWVLMGTPCLGLERMHRVGALLERLGLDAGSCPSLPAL